MKPRCPSFASLLLSLLGPAALLLLAVGCPSKSSSRACDSDDDCDEGQKCNVLVKQCLLTREADERFGKYGSDCEDAIECLHEQCIGNAERHFCSAPCETNDDCDGLGADAVCLTLNENVTTCMLTCEEDSDCILDFVCVADGVCTPPELLVSTEPEPLCDELGQASVCYLHSSVRCVDGTAFAQFCPDENTLCGYDASGESQCVEEGGVDACDLSCRAIESCGNCLSIEDQCLSVDECAGGCRELGLELSEACVNTLAECEVDAFIACAGINEALAANNAAESSPSSPAVTEPNVTPTTPEPANSTPSEPTEPEPTPTEPAPTEPAPSDPPPSPQPGANPIEISGDAWVDISGNAVGIQGPFFTFSDAANGGSSTITPACGDALCFVGPEVCVSGSLGQDAESWGAAVALMASFDAASEESELYDPRLFDVRGFSFVLTGAAVPHVRFTVMAGDGQEYCTTLAREQSAVGLGSLTAECWTPGGTPFMPELGIEQIRWSVPPQADSEFDFCITELAAIVLEDVPQPECVDFNVAPLCTSHQLASCIEGSYALNDCAAAEQLCEPTESSGAACVTPATANSCERVCGDIYSCGLCWAIEDECLTLPGCIALCQAESWNTDCPSAASCDPATIDACVLPPRASPPLQRLLPFRAAGPHPG